MTTPTVTERGRLTALRAAWLFDGTGSALIPDPLVVIDGGTIVAVGSGVPAPDGADVIDLGGAALLPGLVDTHVHLAFDASADPVGALAARSDEEVLEAMVRAGQAVLRAAVDEADRYGLQVTAHAHAVAAIADAVAAGTDGLEHVSFWTEDSVDAPAELIQLIADRRTVVGLTVGMVPVPGLEPPPV